MTSQQKSRTDVIVQSLNIQNNSEHGQSLQQQDDQPQLIYNPQIPQIEDYNTNDQQEDENFLNFDQEDDPSVDNQALEEFQEVQDQFKDDKRQKDIQKIILHNNNDAEYHQIKSIETFLEKTKTNSKFLKSIFNNGIQAANSKEKKKGSVICYFLNKFGQIEKVQIKQLIIYENKVVSTNEYQNNNVLSKPQKFIRRKLICKSIQKQ